MTNNWQEVALAIDPDAKQKGSRMFCRCPNFAAHANGDEKKSFTVTDAPESKWGILWGCLTCGDDPNLKAILDAEGCIKKPPSDKPQSDKPKKAPSDAVAQWKAKRIKDTLKNKEARKVKQVELEEKRKQKGPAPDKGRRYCADRYPYRDEYDGDLVEEWRFQYENAPGEKENIPYHVNKEGNWDCGLTPYSWNDDGEWVPDKKQGVIFAPLQHLKELLIRTHKGDKVYLFEGPKKVRIFKGKAPSLFATCHIGGSNKPWDDRWTLSLKGASEVIVVCDNDEPGRKWGKNVCAKLLAAGIKSKLINLPGLENKGDDFEQYVEQYSMASFLDVVRQTEYYGPDELEVSEIQFELGAFDNTDVANAKRMVARFGRVLRFADELGPHYFDGQRWVHNNSLVYQFAMQNAELIQIEAAEALKASRARDLTKEEKEVFFNDHVRLVKWARDSEEWNRLSTTVKATQKRPGMSCSIKDFDNDELIINTQSGVLDLQTGICHKHKPSFMCSRIMPVLYEPKAKCPVFTEFLKVVTDGDEQLAKFLMRAVGYSLTGLIGEEAMFFLFGSGRNGKSKFVEIIFKMMGSYAGPIPTEALMVQQNKNTANYELAGLVKARMVSASETEQGQRLAEGFLKKVTGGDIIPCRFLNKNFFEYRPEFKLWMTGNYRPQLKGNDPALKDRILIVPFNAYIKEDKRDTMLFSKLCGELPGILNAALEGFRDYWDSSKQGSKKGLNPPSIVKEAVTSYFVDQDPLAGWVETKAVIHPGAMGPGQDLYKSYERYIIRDLKQDHKLGIKTFYEYIENLSNVRSKRVQGGKYFHGIGLKVEDSESETEPEQTHLHLVGNDF